MPFSVTAWRETNKNHNRLYKQKYRLEHRDEIRAYKRRYYSQRSAEILAKRRQKYHTRTLANPNYHKEIRLRNHTKILANYARWHSKLRLDVLRAYSPELKCVNSKCLVPNGCRDIRTLTIDHIDGSGSQHRKELGRNPIKIYTWLRQNNYPSGFQVLCMNCQFIKRVENRELRSSN